MTYYAPGAFFSEETTRPIEDGPDLIERAAAGAPAGTFCFSVATVLVADPVPDGEGGTLQVLPKVVEESGRYYLGGRLFDYDDLQQLGGHQVLKANMRDQWPLVVLTPLGNWQPFEEADVLIGTSR